MIVSIKKKAHSLMVVIMCAVIIATGGVTPVALAKESDIVIAGQIYEFDRDSHYVLDEEATSVATSFGNAIGQLAISGNNISRSSSNNVPSYKTSDGVITLSYTFDQAVLNTNEEDWCIIDDKTKKVNDVQLDSNILSGALILQTSLDNKNWVTEKIDNNTDIFSEDSAFKNAFYKTTDIQLQNGCYYRVYVVYEMQRKLESTKIFFVDKPNYEYKKVAEVYNFYASYTGTSSSAYDTPRKTVGEKYNTGKDNGYSENNTITSDDPHYGWDIGKFIINGYTRETRDSSGKTYFLKNVGDKVTLWFTLDQDINCLNDNSDLSIADDTDGYDQHFETDKTDFGRGTLIIQYTDEEGIKHDPIIYTNYLAANARTGANTKVQLFEEGDYEVSLDYKIAKKFGPRSLLTSYSDYKVYFSFSIRNGNCMVYPFDIVTGRELADHGITDNGFTLDMAKSKYLTIDVTRSTLTMGADGQLVEDVRFNRPAKDGDMYTDEGIYTFVVRNLYTGESTTKTICVGSDQYLNALSATGYTVAELNAQLAQGATISESGIIVEKPEAIVEPEAENSPDETAFVDAQEEEIPDEKLTNTVSLDAEQNTMIPVFAGIGALILVLILVLFVFTRKHQR